MCISLQPGPKFIPIHRIWAAGRRSESLFDRILMILGREHRLKCLPSPKELALSFLKAVNDTSNSIHLGRELPQTDKRMLLTMETDVCLVDVLSIDTGAEGRCGLRDYTRRLPTLLVRSQGRRCG